MAKKKKILLKPKSDIGMNRELPMCYNCMWRHKDTGWCPMYDEFYDYNHICPTKKIFRYNFELMELGYKNLHI